MTLNLDLKSITSHVLEQLGVDVGEYEGSDLVVTSPIDNSILIRMKTDDLMAYSMKVNAAKKAFMKWRDVPAPKRGELIRVFANHLRDKKELLAKLVTIECGKIIEEARGEVQEMIDICDFSVGLSRQLYGLTIASERRNHVMHENWLPLGPIGVISAFNFPVAVWSWNFALAVVCGDAIVWKPSEKTPLTALACQSIFDLACKEYDSKNYNEIKSLNSVILGRADLGKQMSEDSMLPLISATGSSSMGQSVGKAVASRLGRSLLELGGNNAVIVSPSSDLEIVIPSLVFGSVGTTGQRCTTTRRAIVHDSIYDKVVNSLIESYEFLRSKIGNPLNSSTVIGPLIDQFSIKKMQDVLEEAKNVGMEVFGGEEIDPLGRRRGNYVTPSIIKVKEQQLNFSKIREETFAPILYIMPYRDIEEAININNNVPQGLSSSIFTTDLREAELFKKHSDCGIANINIGTSGAEIGGAFGGEKMTGGGREAGSDSWKVYMRRQTSTTYYSKELPELAQGIKFTT